MTSCLRRCCAPWPAHDGNYGVTIFFAISGFLITTHTLRRFGTPAQVDLRRFYLLRAGRILPPLVLVLALIVGLGTSGLPSFVNTDGDHGPAPHVWIAAGSVLTFWHNVLMQQIGYFNYSLNIYWSLSVEEVFYLLLPVLCVTLKRERRLLAVCLAASVAGPWYRSLHADNELFFMYGYLACFDAIAMGCIGAVLAQPWRIGLVDPGCCRRSRRLPWPACTCAASPATRCSASAAWRWPAPCICSRWPSGPGRRRRVP